MFEFGPEDREPGMYRSIQYFNTAQPREQNQEISWWRANKLLPFLETQQDKVESYGTTFGKRIQTSVEVGNDEKEPVKDEDENVIWVGDNVEERMRQHALRKATKAKMPAEANH
jgi:hypothetical protein